MTIATTKLPSPPKRKEFTPEEKKKMQEDLLKRMFSELRNACRGLGGEWDKKPDGKNETVLDGLVEDVIASYARIEHLMPGCKFSNMLRSARWAATVKRVQKQGGAIIDETDERFAIIAMMCRRFKLKPGQALGDAERASADAVFEHFKKAGCWGNGEKLQKFMYRIAHPTNELSFGAGEALAAGIPLMWLACDSPSEFINEFWTLQAESPFKIPEMGATVKKTEEGGVRVCFPKPIFKHPVLVEWCEVKAQTNLRRMAEFINKMNG